MPEVPPGSFDLASFLLSELDMEGYPGVHFFGVILEHPVGMDFFALSSAYRLACEKKDLELLPVPFGMKEKCPKEATIQMVLVKQPDGSHTIVKHMSFPEKLKPRC